MREAIVKKLHSDGGEFVTTNNILVTVGAMEGTAAAILSLVEYGDRVGVITPDYCNHFPQVMLARGEIIPIPLQEGAAWMIDLVQVERQAKQGIKLLILTNPGNPTGFVASGPELAALVDLANTYGFWILADETYSYLTYDTPFTSLTFLAGVRSHDHGPFFFQRIRHDRLARGIRGGRRRGCQNIRQSP